MTVQYNQLVLTGGPGVFFRLLLKWRGCIFKLIYIDVIVFMALYTLISCVYRYVLSDESQRAFEEIIIFTRSFQGLIPVSFILGFYIDNVFMRFWRLFMTIPWAFKFCISIAGHLCGNSERARLMRRTCFRYMMSSLIMTSTRLNLVAKKRFPTPEFFVAAGILTEEELEIIINVNPVHVQPFVPIVWTTSLITLAGKEGFITNHHALVSIIDEINNFRQGLLDMFMIDFVCIPLVYTQVVTLAVYIYFIASLVGRQFIIDSSPYSSKINSQDLYFPFFMFLEFIVYVGLLKVAETLVNPMGENDEDIDINEVIDFNWKTGWCIVDGMKKSAPAIVRDLHWRQSVIELPHTHESKRLASRPFRGSTYNINFPFNADMLGSALSLSQVGPSQDLTPRYLIRHSTINIPVRVMQTEATVPSEADSTLRLNALDDHTAMDIMFPSPSPSNTPVANRLHEPIKEEDEEHEDDDQFYTKSKTSVII
ncbi:Bestrophin-2 [Schistosoma japonicum]|nr:Bestrophin-2 [Schistosoma japonicum]